jgi:hypothetical protein
MLPFRNRRHAGIEAQTTIRKRSLPREPQGSFRNLGFSTIALGPQKTGVSGVSVANHRILLLGTVELWNGDGVQVPLSGPKRAATLATLALGINQLVPVERFFDIP